MNESAIYIHIPFCDHKCIYCDFYSVVTKKDFSNYLNSLKKEIAYYANIYSEKRIFTSIFLGGGTPSLMEPDYIKDIINCVKGSFHISNNVEITLEANPGTIDINKLVQFHQHGINRISIGVQSFIDEELKFLTRIHNKDLAIQSVINSMKAGFKNINIDLIFNLPGQDKEKWLYSLQTAVELPVTHISAYSLILERGTQLNKMVLDRKITLPDIDYDGEIYEMTIDYLNENSFHQYEVSNYAKEGFECRHNKAYWNYRDYLSFGTSAHSFMNGKRWWNFSNLQLYMSNIDKSGTAIAGFEELTSEQMLNEYVMLALRSNGLNLISFQKKFGNEWLNKKYSKLKSFERRGLLFFENDEIVLTKKGYAVCDEILEKIL